MAFPYVSASEDVNLEDSLVSGFAEACGDDLGIGNVAFLGSCSMGNGNREETAALQSVQVINKFTWHDQLWNIRSFLVMVAWCFLLSIITLQAYLTKRKEESHKGKTDLVVFCNGPQASQNVDRTQSEGTSTSELWALSDIILPSAECSHACCIFLGEVLSELISSVEESGAKYAVLYVSDISRSIQYPSYRDLQRFLAESTSGNGSTNSTACDGVCQLKSSLLEGLLVVSFFAHLYKRLGVLSCWFILNLLQIR
jgi:hypothetical protein